MPEDTYKLEPYEFRISGTLIRLRRASAVEWDVVNPILDKDELAYDTTERKFKRGNGVTHWRDLDWFLEVV